MDGPQATGYVQVNGTDMYWEERGEGGVPLLVVHGGYGLASMFGELLDAWAQRRRVIAIELRGHGHTRDTGGAFSFQDFGDDIAGVIEALGLGQADLLGYSLGGSACLRAAIQHPALVRRLVLASIPCRRDGWFPEVRAGFDQMSSAGFEPMSQSPVYAAWRAVAPDPGSFPALMDKTGELLRQPYDWTGEVQRLSMPVLLVYADADSVALSHIAEFYALLGGGTQDAGWDRSRMPSSQLAILPGMTHYDIFQAPRFGEVTGEFLG